MNHPEIVTTPPTGGWTPRAIQSLLEAPLLALVHAAQGVHRAHQPPDSVQLANLLSIKTGACPEDCKYCAQSARFDTGLERERLMETDAVVETARAARAAGATRFCMGAAWRQVRDGADFDRVLEMVSGVRRLGLEVCATLGMMTEDQARRLREAGLTAYNHNLDTGREHYGEIVTTHGYDDRLETLRNARAAGLELCCGGIIGMGESVSDRADLLATLANLAPPPESVPINALVPVPGTPLGHLPPVDPLDLVRTIAAARIAMPRSRVRLSAGRRTLSREAQVLCFLAGANSIFFGDKLLTTANPDANADAALLSAIGARPLDPFEDSAAD